MQQAFKSLHPLFKRKAVISLFIIILLAVGVGLYWHFAQSQEIVKLNVGGKENACTCTQRLNQ
jgi:hypothetical protein